MPTRNEQFILNAFFPNTQIKIWSLVVTVFGDLAAQEHDSLSGVQLKALFEIMSIKPDALRVALHRLMKDGWIVSERIGRNSEYRLSEFGIAETKKVWQRVYRPVHETNRQWYIAVLPNSLPNNDVRTVKLAAQTYIVDQSFLAENDHAISFPFQAATAPAWIGEKILKDGIGELSTTLLSAFDNMPNTASVVNDIQRVAIRILCMHQWRRIVLRDASLLHMQYFEKGNIRRCHDHIHQLHKDIPRDFAAKVMNKV